MSGHTTLIAQSIQSTQNRVVAHRNVLVVGTWEHQSAIAREQFERQQYFHGLTGQGNDVRHGHLHPFRWNHAGHVIKVELRPWRLDEFAGAHEGM